MNSKGARSSTIRLVHGILDSCRGDLGRLNGAAMSRLYRCGKVNPTGTVAVLTTSRLKGHQGRRRKGRHGIVLDSHSICRCFCPLVYSLPARRY